MIAADEARFCPGCGAENLPEVRFCRQCGLDLEMVDSGDETLVLELPVPEKVESSWPRITLIQLMIVIGIIGILAAIAIPNFRRGHHHDREKSCYANMRVILGAVEMYNMDHLSMMSSIDDKMVTDPGSLLKTEQYLKGQIYRPDVNCRYGSFGDLTGQGRITCAVHGQVE